MSNLLKTFGRQINFSMKMKRNKRLLGGRLKRPVVHKEDRNVGQPRPGINSKFGLAKVA